MPGTAIESTPLVWGKSLDFEGKKAFCQHYFKGLQFLCFRNTVPKRGKTRSIFGHVVVLLPTSGNVPKSLIVFCLYRKNNTATVRITMGSDQAVYSSYALYGEGFFPALKWLVKAHYQECPHNLRDPGGSGPCLLVAMKEPFHAEPDIG